MTPLFPNFFFNKLFSSPQVTNKASFKALKPTSQYAEHISTKMLSINFRQKMSRACELVFEFK